MTRPTDAKQPMTAAEALEEVAASGVSYDAGKYVEVQIDKDTWDQVRALAASLPSAAYTAKNPLGGPAAMFRTIAERLEAGEDYAAVLADYGLRSEKSARPNDPLVDGLHPVVHEAIDNYAKYYTEHHKLGLSIRDDMRYVAQVATRWATSQSESAAPPVHVPVDFKAWLCSEMPPEDTKAIFTRVWDLYGGCSGNEESK